MKKQTAIPVYGRGNAPFSLSAGKNLPSLKGDARCEILIIGGGLSGLSCGYELLKRDEGVILCEAGKIGGGGTAFRPPSLSVGITMTELCRFFPYGEALSAFREMKMGVEWGEEAVSVCGKRTPFTVRDGLLYLPDKKKYSGLEREFRLRRYGGLPCVLLTEEECLLRYSFRCEGAISDPGGCAETDYGMLCEDMAEYISLRGGVCYEKSPVRELIETEEGFRAVCPEGTVTAKRVIDCRGWAILPKGTEKITVSCTASEKNASFSGWKDRCVIRDFSPHTVTACSSPDGRISAEGFPGKRLFRQLSEELAQERLAGRAEEMFYSAAGAPFSLFWERNLLRSEDGLPYMGRQREDGKLWFLAPCGEWGSAASFFGARKIAQALTGSHEASGCLKRYEPF